MLNKLNSTRVAAAAREGKNLAALLGAPPPPPVRAREGGPTRRFGLKHRAGVHGDAKPPSGLDSGIPAPGPGRQGPATAGIGIVHTRAPVVLTKLAFPLRALRDSDGRPSRQRLTDCSSPSWRLRSPPAARTASGPGDEDDDDGVAAAAVGGDGVLGAGRAGRRQRSRHHSHAVVAAFTSSPDPASRASTGYGTGQRGGVQCRGAMRCRGVRTYCQFL